MHVVPILAMKYSWSYFSQFISNAQAYLRHENILHSLMPRICHISSVTIKLALYSKLQVLLISTRRTTFLPAEMYFIHSILRVGAVAFYLGI